MPFEITPGIPDASGSITPVTRDATPGSAEPMFVQWQQGHEDLGPADVLVVNFTYPLIATRGVGEHENVITVRRAPAPPAPPPPPGDPYFANVIALYPFDGDLLDYSGHGRHAAFQGVSGFNQGSFGPPGGRQEQTQSLRGGGPLVGNSAGSAIAVFTPVSLAKVPGAGQGAFTIESDFFAASFVGSNVVVFSVSDGSNGFSIVPGSAGLQVQFHDGSGTLGSVNYTDGQKHFVSMSRADNSTLVKVAVDGDLIGTFNSVLGLEALPDIAFASESVGYAGVNTWTANVRLTADVDRYPTFPYLAPTQPFPVS